MNKAKSEFLPLDKAKSVHIIFPVGSNIYSNAAYELTNMLSVAGLKVCRTSWLDTLKKLDEQSLSDETVLTNRDFNIFHWPKKLNAIPCLRQCEDYIIMLGKGDELKMLSVVAISPVKCKVGPFHQLSREVFDIGYSFSQEASPNEMAMEIIRILKMIRNER